MKKYVIPLILCLLVTTICSCKKSNPKNPQQTHSQTQTAEQTDNSEIDYKLYASCKYNGEKAPLTLEDVKELSKMGEILTWSHLENFIGIDTGSGLFIRVYDIDKDYRLSIGGSCPDEKPMYVYLTCLKAPYERIDIRYDDVDVFLKHTSKIKNGTKRFIATVVSNGEVSIPSDAFIEGRPHDNGKIILSVKDTGNTEFKNDDLYMIVKDELTGGVPCPRLIPGDIVRIEMDDASSVITSGEIPNKIEKAVSVDRCSELGETITPLESLPADYSLEDATNDNCVVYSDFDVIHGKEFFDSFLANVKYNSPTNVRLVFHYSESSSVYVQDLYFNGTTYTLRQMDNGVERLDSYKYLMTYTDAEDGSTAYLRYVLTNDNTVSYSDLVRGLLSSKYGDYIPHATVYQQRIPLVDGEHPVIDLSPHEKENIR